MRVTPTASSLLLALAGACLPAQAQTARDKPPAQSVTRRALPDDHPLIGQWRFEVPDTPCHELYDIRADGTTRVTSGREVAESEFDMSHRPNPQGFYRWIDRLVKDNGLPDCTGEIAKPGQVSTNFILLHRSGDQFLMCEDESLEACIGPFVRQDPV